MAFNRLQLLSLDKELLLINNTIVREWEGAFFFYLGSMVPGFLDPVIS
jgi:hypothetical protein